MQKIFIYTGKGGVGKTSIAAATAVKLAGERNKVLIMSTDPAHSLGDSLGAKLSGEPTTIFDGLDAMEIDSVSENRKAWGELRDYLAEIMVHKNEESIVAEEALVFPGLEEMFSLLVILDAYEQNRYDVLLVDCAPTGETLALLSYPEKLRSFCDKVLPMLRNVTGRFGTAISSATTVPKPKDEVFTEFDALIKRLEELEKIMKNREICAVRIVMTPERIVLKEAQRNYAWMKAYDFNVDAVCVNKIYPEEAMDGRFSGWIRTQADHLAEARQSFADCLLFYLPLQEAELLGTDRLAEAADTLYGDTDPSAILSATDSYRIETKPDGSKILIISLPFFSENEIRIEKHDSELFLTIRNEARYYRLPEEVALRTITGYDYADDTLRIVFER